MSALILFYVNESDLVVRKGYQLEAVVNFVAQKMYIKISCLMIRFAQFLFSSEHTTKYRVHLLPFCSLRGLTQCSTNETMHKLCFSTLFKGRPHYLDEPISRFSSIIKFAYYLRRKKSNEQPFRLSPYLDFGFQMFRKIQMNCCLYTETYRYKT